MCDYGTELFDREEFVVSGAVWDWLADIEDHLDAPGDAQQQARLVAVWELFGVFGPEAQQHTKDEAILDGFDALESASLAQLLALPVDFSEMLAETRTRVEAYHELFVCPNADEAYDDTAPPFGGAP